MLGISWFSYWLVPIFSGFVWLGMLLGMLLFWVVHQHSMPITPMDVSAGQHIAYISDIGAHQMQPLFIAGGTVTVVTFNAVFIAERWLRHKNRLAANTSWTQKTLSILSIVFAMIGGIALICLTCLNDIKHSKAHDRCLVIFIAGYIISAIFICWEYQRLGIHYREYRILAASFWIKLMFIFVELGLAIAFGVLGYQKHYNAAAYCEWLVSLIYAFYVWSFALDFLPAISNKHGEVGGKESGMEMGTAEAVAENDASTGHNGTYGTARNF